MLLCKHLSPGVVDIEIGGLILVDPELAQDLADERDFGGRGGCGHHGGRERDALLALTDIAR